MIPIHSCATVNAWRSNPALWGSFQLPHHPSLVYQPANTPSHPPLHQNRGFWQQITPAHSVYETKVLLRGDLCIKVYYNTSANNVGSIYGCAGQPPFCFCLSLSHVGLSNFNVLFVYEQVMERPVTAEQMVMLSPGETRATLVQGELGDLTRLEAMFFYCILFTCLWNEPYKFKLQPK